ncbi:MAG: AraC family transcriptional regulator [Acidobacteria bacterium]|nr:AraC family transcriptional regulator [Acidobacteriota bacterium]
MMEMRRNVIEVWHPPDLGQLEARRGFGVVRPVPRHCHEEYQLCFIQAGDGELCYRGRSLSTPPTSLFMVYPGEVHANRPFDQDGCSYRTLFLGPELMRRAATEAHQRERGLPFFPTAVVFDEELIGRYLRLHRALERHASSLERQTLLYSFLNTLILRFAEQRPSPRRPGTGQHALRRAYDYLAEHYAENISLDQLAAVAHLSLFHFTRVFAERYGMPPHAFQTQLRVLRAKALLREGLAISQVAQQTGFADQSHLTRHFKRLVAITPGQYAQNSKNIQDSI